MKLSNKQKTALGKITSKSWNSWHPEAIEAYFAFTDRGEHTPLFNRVWKGQPPDNEFNEKEQDLWDLMQAHGFHPVTVEMWKEDFKKGLLFPQDFYEQGYPDAYVKHALEIYKESHRSY